MINKFFEKLFKDNTDAHSEPFLLNMAGHYMVSGRWEDALKCCDEATKIDPNSKKAWYNKGVILEKLERLPDALDSYEKAILIDKYYILPWYGKGVILGKQKKYKDELSCYENALKIDMEFIPALFGKATALDDLGEYESALIYHDKALLLDSSSASAQDWSNRGNTLSHLNRFEEAIESFKKALEIDPNFICTLGNIANTYRQMEKYEEALKYYSKALKTKPRDPILHFGKGLTFYSLENFEYALYHAEKAKIFGNPETGGLIISCIEKLSPGTLDTLRSSTSKLPKKLPNNNGKCKQCGKDIVPDDTFYNEHLNGWICWDCMISLLPEKDKSVTKIKHTVKINIKQ